MCRPGIERREIRDIVAYLKLVLNPADRMAFARVINTPRRGVGPKTAAAVVRHFGSIDDLFQRLDEVAGLPIRGAKTLGPKLAAAEAEARLALSLVTLRADAPMGLSARDMDRHSRWSGPLEAEADGLFDRMGFHRPLNHLRALARTLI